MQARTDYQEDYHTRIIKPLELIGIDNKMISSENHELLEDKYAPTYRSEDNRNRRFRNIRNTTWNISCRLIITTVS